MKWDFVLSLSYNYGLCIVQFHEYVSSADNRIQSVPVYITVACFLVSEGASLETKSNEGLTPLHLCPPEYRPLLELFARPERCSFNIVWNFYTEIFLIFIGKVIIEGAYPITELLYQELVQAQQTLRLDQVAFSVRGRVISPSSHVATLPCVLSVLSLSNDAQLVR